MIVLVSLIVLLRGLLVTTMFRMVHPCIAPFIQLYCVAIDIIDP